MTGSPTEQTSHVFRCLHGMVRTAALYPPMHAQTVKAKQTLHDALTAYLSSHGRLVYRFLRSEEHTSELQSRLHLVCRLLLEKKKKNCRRDHRLLWNPMAFGTIACN